MSLRAVMTMIVVAVAALPASAKTPFQISEFQWSAGQSPVLLPSSDTHVCMLTGITGKFAGEGELVELATTKVPGAAAPIYVLRGRSGQAQLRAFATCVQKKQMTSPGFFGALAISDNMAATALECPAYTYNTSGGYTKSAIPFIAAVGGALRGRGEEIIADAAAGKGAVTLRACSGWVTGGARTYLSPLGKPIFFRTTYGSTTNLATSLYKLDHIHNAAFGDQHYVTAFSPDGKEVAAADGWLLPVDDAICGLVELQGKFNGYGERAQVRPALRAGVNWWRLESTTASEDGYIHANVRCIARDQTGT